jgi:phosphoglycolate phosphatase
MSWPRAIVFDLDGTLIDSAGDIADALNACLADERLPPFDEPAVVTMIGGGARVLVERALLRIGRSGDLALTDRLHRAFETRYAALGAGRSAPFPGAVELLADLTAAGVALGICTNKPQAITRSVLDQLELTRWFAVIVGETPERPRKPHPAMLLAAIEGLSAAIADAVMIGDSAADVGTARAAGVPVVAVSFGYTTTPPAALGADLLIDRLADLPGALSRLPRLSPGICVPREHGA